MLRRGAFAERHFAMDDPNCAFACYEEDPISRKAVRRLVPNPAAKTSFAQLLARAGGERSRVAALADLLDRMTALDPERRLSPDDALRHPFIRNCRDVLRQQQQAAAAAAAAAAGK